MSRYSYNSLSAIGMSTRTGQAYVDLRDGVSVNLVIPPRRSSMSFSVVRFVSPAPVYGSNDLMRSASFAVAGL
jgi:hypothetical protein